jgi:hypothetical protein
MKSRPWTANAPAGITRWFHYDPATDQFTIQTVFAYPKEQNRRLYNQFEKHTRWTDGGERVAQLPLTIYCELREKGMFEPTPEAQKRLRAWLNDPDNRVFRTRPGRV